VDLATLIGMIGAFAMIIMAMTQGGELGMFIDVPSVLIVFCGSPFVVMMMYSMSQFVGAGKVMAKAFMIKLDDPQDLIAKSVELADAARKGGFLALEEAEIPSSFMQKGIDMLVDGHEADVVKATLGKDIDLTLDRHKAGAGFFKSLGDVGPAMGMIGTLIGLVAMLQNMDDPKSIGPAMAVALLTTMYGAMLANLIALPISEKLNLRGTEEAMNQTLILDSILAIQDGQNPRVIEGMLQNYLAEGKRPVAEE